MSRRSRLLVLFAIVALFTSALPLASAGAASRGDQASAAKGAKEKPDKPGKPGGGGNPQEPAPSTGPTDYIAKADTLSQPDYPEITGEVQRVAMHDGVELYVEVVRPDPDVHGNGPWPVVLEASPYHGTLADRDGTRIFPDPVDAEGNLLGLTGYFAPRGYSVVMVDLRGTGRSGGCLDHLGPNDAKDLKRIVEWAADQEWSNGKVGMTGHSYVGSTPSVAAAQNPRGLATIVPSAGLASMYDHQFNKGVPWLLQWIGPMVAYESLALGRDMPSEVPFGSVPVVGAPSGDNFDSNGPNPEIGCGLQHSAAISGTGQVTGQYELWHARRDWRERAADADIPMFMIHGVNDNAARIPAAEWFFTQRIARPGDKVWIGQWDHGSTNGRCGDTDGARVAHPTCRFEQFQYALHAWFDKHLKGMNVDTGPAVEAFLNGETPVDVTEVTDPETWGTKVLTADAWRRPAQRVSLFPDASDMSLDLAAPESADSASFSTGAQAVLASAEGESLEFTSEPVAEDTVFMGLPRLRLNASVTTGEIVHLVTTLHREDAQGNREPMNFCGIQPQLRHGVETIAPVVPTEEMELPLQCFTMGHWVPAGQRLVLEVSGSTPHHATFGGDPQITVFTGPGKTAYTLPQVPDATLHDDATLRVPKPVQEFPVGPAQAPVSGQVIVPVSGAGAIVEPVTAAAFEFDTLEGFDNAKLDVLATPTLPADLDLYLQQQNADGSWSGNLAAGETGELDHEALSAGRLLPGHYRILVHNWAGAPTPVDLELTFYNQEGVAGVADGASSETGTFEGMAHKHLAIP